MFGYLTEKEQKQDSASPEPLPLCRPTSWCNEWFVQKLLAYQKQTQEAQQRKNII